MARSAVSGRVRRRAAPCPPLRRRQRLARTSACSSSGSATARWTSPSSRASSRQRTLLSSRRGAYILPKYVFGRPLDQIGINGPMPLLPLPVRRTMLRGDLPDRRRPGRGFRPAGARPPDRRGPPDGLGGLPQSDRAWRDHMEAEHLPARDAIASASRTDSREQIDVIVWCTGLQGHVSRSSTTGADLRTRQRPVALRRVFKPGIENLFFVGLLQPLGAIMPLSEAQGRVGRRLSVPATTGCRPSRDHERRHRTRASELMFRRYVVLEAAHDAGRFRRLPARPRRSERRSRRARGPATGCR